MPIKHRFIKSSKKNFRNKKKIKFKIKKIISGSSHKPSSAHGIAQEGYKVKKNEYIDQCKDTWGVHLDNEKGFHNVVEIFGDDFYKHCIINGFDLNITNE